jgi:hypothetical protein
MRPLCADGNSFKTIGSVPANGNTHMISNYSFTDTNPFKGLNFYRLKQSDKDGGFTNSKIISLYFDRPTKLFISPNPVTDLLQVQLPQGNNYTSVNILNASGKLVLKKNIANSSTIVRLDIQNLARGWYTLKLNGKESWQQSFIKR